MNSRLLKWVLFVATLTATGLSTAEQPGWPPEAGIVLDKFVGNWNTKVDILHEGEAPGNFHVTGHAVGEKTLGGRFFEFRSKSHDGENSDLQIMTYDPTTSRYLQWVFDADGYRHQASGYWDKDSSTLVWEGQTEKASFIIRDHWLSANRLEWSLERKVGGQLIQTISGVVSRQN